jgi:hypothetical protein
MDETQFQEAMRAATLRGRDAGEDARFYKRLRGRAMQRFLDEQARKSDEAAQADDLVGAAFHAAAYLAATGDDERIG